MDLLTRNLTHQEELILKAISQTTSISLEDVIFIYKILQSFDKTIAIIKEATQMGESPAVVVEIAAIAMKNVISKIDD